MDPGCEMSLRHLSSVCKGHVEGVFDGRNSPQRILFSFFFSIFFLFFFGMRWGLGIGIFFNFIYFQREEKERERNINVWLTLTCPTGDPLGTRPTTQACAPTGNQPATPPFTGRHSIHWATPARAENTILKHFSPLGKAGTQSFI